ncbi:TonB-dependent receptor [Portibacter marinus]|uniref:TonB-dependent receptor n=1 Tax=Portibacter marinus TaxID=2898660 RepID=UPI0021D47813|nr:TonB-dependent receptor [Portibacter marinus]
MNLSISNRKFFSICVATLIFCLGAHAQSGTTITGSIVDQETGVPLIGATIIEPSSGRGTVTDLNGEFALNVSSLPTRLEISYTGFVLQNLDVTSADNLEVSLAQSFSRLDEVVVVGTRGKPRTILDSAVPIDNINSADLQLSGQASVDQMINYRVPSYNSTNQTISDATAHFDPSELRNLGPSRTLVLVNGKRKNQSALVYVNDTPGKGEVGTDMKSIPVEAIERVEVLRDGAAAQYGSDAIAGVINIVLKERLIGEITAGAGITTAGDGLTYEAGINKGFSVGKGILNLTASYYHQDLTNRAGEPGGDGLFGVIFGDEAILNGTHPWIQENPDLGMTIGQPEYDKISGFANFENPYANGAGEFYAFGGYTYRDGKSFALYRAPYWITDDAGLLTPDGETYQGFQPTFETTIGDLSFTVGNRYNVNGWNTDLSLSTGSNSVSYIIGNTINPALLPNSPTEFDAGAYSFGNILGNLDFSKAFGSAVLSFGSEIRRERFVVEAGQEESYVDGGAQSFPGLQPGNALDETRSNVGVYAGLDYDITEDFLLGGAFRYENYSDFGGNFSWKVNGRYKLSENGAIRASASTGFRAPSLHQIYLSNVQTLVSGGTVSNQGTFNNVDPVIKALGVPSLDAETSLNFTAGLTYKLLNNLSFTADYYNIAVDNRVLFTGEIGFDGDDTSVNPVEQILIDNSVTSIKFFVNALDTRTSGVDLVLDYRDVALGSSASLDLILSANFNQTNIDGTIEAPGVIGAEGYNIFNRKEQSRITSARPNQKVLVGANVKFGKFRIALNNTYFGSVTWQHATDPDKDQTFTPRVLTDVIAGYALSSNADVNLVINNIFNVYPDEIDTGGDFVTDLGGRFRYPWEVNQFGFMGTIVKVRGSYKF